VILVLWGAAFILQAKCNGDRFIFYAMGTDLFFMQWGQIYFLGRPDCLASTATPSI